MGVHGESWSDGREDFRETPGLAGFFCAASPSPEEAANRMKRKWKRPADAASSGGPQGSNLINHDRPLNNRPAPRLQASYPADDAGEDAWQYFRARPGATVRLRLPWPGE